MQLRQLDRETLFGKSPGFIRRLCAPTESLLALEFARELLTASFPSLRTRACFITLEEPGCCGRFVVHELPATPVDIHARMTCLDDFSVVTTHEDFTERQASDPDALFGLPEWPEADFLKRAPLDIAIRAIMILRHLAKGQRQRGSKLFLRAVPDVARAITQEYALHYPKNMARHDMDRLQRLQLINFAPDGTARLGLTPAGMFRVHVLEHRFNRLLPRAPHQMLTAIRAQEELWFEATRL
jgi:hypothetical protein